MIKNKLTVSFTTDAYKYTQYKDICRRNGVMPARELNAYIQDVINEDNDSYVGY